MSDEINIYDDGLEEYPWPVVIIENLFILLWIGSGTIFCWSLNSLFGFFYISFAGIMLIFVMRKLLCTRCYYYGKRCHVGWGEISALLYSKGEISEFKSCSGGKIAPPLFGSLALIPLISAVVSLVKRPELYSVILLFILLFSIILSSVHLRKKSCSKCKMKLMCSGSAAK